MGNQEKKVEHEREAGLIQKVQGIGITTIPPKRDLGRSCLSVFGFYRESCEWEV